MKLFRRAEPRHLRTSAAANSAPLTGSSHCPNFCLTHGEPMSRRIWSEGEAESVPKEFGTDPLNLLQVMLAKGSNARLGPPSL